MTGGLIFFLLLKVTFVCRFYRNCVNLQPDMEERNKITEEQESDNIYVYVEDGEKSSDIGLDQSYDGLDKSGPNFSQVSPDDIPEDAPDPSDVSPLAIMLKVLINPVEGWKELRRTSLSCERVQQGCFYPMMAVYAASIFSRLYYAPRTSLSEVLVAAVIGFVSFFFGYFCIMLVIKGIMGKIFDKKSDGRFCRQFVMISLSTLCLFSSLLELLPMLWAVLIFLPVWTIYSECRGARFFKFPDNRRMTYTGLMCVLTVGIPYAIAQLLQEILPK